MITLETVNGAIVSTPQNSSLFFGPGTWHFDQLLTVKGSTNPPTDVSLVRDGGIVAVDSAGVVEVYMGPDLASSALWGFAAAFVTVGMVLFSRWVIKRFGGALLSGGLPE